MCGWIRAACAAALVVGCGGAQANVSASTSAPAGAARAGDATAAATAPRADEPATITLAEPGIAVVSGRRVPFDGVAEGMAWPALTKALGEIPKAVTIAVGRDAPIVDVLRAAWTVRAADVHIRTPDAAGAPRVIDLAPKQATPAVGCHLAVFVRADGSLRIAAPGGPRAIHGDAPAAQLARALEEERRRCPIRYVAFGAEGRDARWGAVFDVAEAVDREKSAGDARYVLGESVAPVLRNP